MKRDISGASTKSGNRDRAPFSTTFSISLLGEWNNSPTPMDIARDQARTEHFEKIAAKERRREERDEERIRLAETNKKKLKKTKKTKKSISTAPNESLAVNGLAVVTTLAEGSETRPNVQATATDAAIVSPEDVSEDSDWDSEAFEDEYYDHNDRLDDECDFGIPFDPPNDTVCMSNSVLLSTAVRPPPAILTDDGQSVPSTVQITNVQDGLKHILTTLGIPNSAQEVFIRVSEPLIYILASITSNSTNRRTWPR